MISDEKKAIKDVWTEKKWKKYPAGLYWCICRPNLCRKIRPYLYTCIESRGGIFCLSSRPQVCCPPQPEFRCHRILAFPCHPSCPEPIASRDKGPFVLAIKLPVFQDISSLQLAWVESGKHLFVLTFVDSTVCVGVPVELDSNLFQVRVWRQSEGRIWIHAALASEPMIAV